MAKKLADRLYSEYADEMEDFALYVKPSMSATQGVLNAVRLIEAMVEVVGG